MCTCGPPFLTLIYIQNLPYCTQENMIHVIKFWSVFSVLIITIAYTHTHTQFKWNLPKWKMELRKIWNGK